MFYLSHKSYTTFKISYKFITTVTGTKNKSNWNRLNTLKTRIRNAPHLKRKFGQHLLVNPEILFQIVESAEIKQFHDTILEIGPGTGNLTEVLLSKSPRQVVSVEYDPRMTGFLHKRFPNQINNDKLRVIEGDFCKKKLPPYNICVANIPYGISSSVINRLVTDIEKNGLDKAVLLVQDEFATRLSANENDEDYSRLSVSTRLHCDIKSLLFVGRENFQPPPKVNSRVICLTKRKEPFPVVDTDRFRALLSAIFLRKHRTIRSMLFPSLEKTWKVFEEIPGCSIKDSVYDLRQAKNILHNMLIKNNLLDKRAMQMSTLEFVRLYKALDEAGFKFIPAPFF